MRALAQLISSGRIQAGMVAFFGNIIPFISPAAVSLVTLTKGLSDGLVLSLYAITPLTIILIYATDANTVVTMLSIFTVFCVLIGSSIMRLRSSWQEVLVFIVVFSAISTMFASIFFNDSLVALENIIIEFFKDNQNFNDNLLIGRAFLLGVAGYVIALTSIVSVILGRWWQAMLFNPGGFKLEFHQLRFSSLFSVTILIGMFFCEFFLEGYTSWSSLLSLPLMLGGIALLHYTVTLYQLSGFWLVGFYLALLFLSPLSIMLVGIGFLDSIFNIRPKLISHIK
ncbi:MAG: hypothetical protein ACR2PE_00895 [Porticoccus sp.]